MCNKNRKKGETLIEGLISMFIVSLVLVPLSTVLTNTVKTNMKIDEKINSEQMVKNMFEIIKTKELESFLGEYNIKDVHDFYNNFNIDDKYKILSEKNIIKNLKISVEKINKGKKENFIKIKIDKIEEEIKIK